MVKRKKEGSGEEVDVLEAAVAEEKPVRHKTVLLTSPSGSILIYRNECYPATSEVLSWASAVNLKHVESDSDEGRELGASVKKANTELPTEAWDEIRNSV